MIARNQKAAKVQNSLSPIRCISLPARYPNVNLLWRYAIEHLWILWSYRTESNNLMALCTSWDYPRLMDEVIICSLQYSISVCQPGETPPYCSDLVDTIAATAYKGIDSRLLAPLNYFRGISHMTWDRLNESCEESHRSTCDGHVQS